MKVIQIGSFAIFLKWLLFGGAMMIGLILLKLWLHRSQPKDVNKQLFDIVTNSVFWGFLIWKGSLLLLEPKLVMKSPLSLLYFTGGSTGLIIAITSAIIYFMYKARKQQLTGLVAFQTVFIFSAIVSSGYHFLSQAFLETSMVYHFIFGGLTLLLLLSFLLNRSLFFKKEILILAVAGLLLLGLYDVTLKSDTLASQNLEQIDLSDTKRLETGVFEGKKAPNFQLQTLDGKQVNLSDFAGTKVILNFWATWCPPCKAEMPHMEGFYVEHKNDGVVILAVNLTTSEKSIGAVEEFQKDYRITFPVLLDTNGEISDTYQAITIPTSYLIDSKGIIRKKIIGPMDKNMLVELINSVE